MAGLIRRTIEMARLGRAALRLRGASSEAVRANARLALIRTMGRARGLPQKMGQILSMSGDAGADDFRALTDHAEPLPFDIIRDELRQAWGTAPEETLRTIDPVGLAASLGQVHRGELTDGTEVAVKVRYPDVEQAVVNDLNFLGWLSLPVGGLKCHGFDLEGYRAEILRDLDEELDYRVEAGHQKEFAELAREMPFLVVPEVVDRLSTDRVLVSHWRQGNTIEEVAAQWSAVEKRALGKQLLILFFRSLFGHGLLHADPHAGNYRFGRNGDQPEVVLYDFGSVTRLDEARRLALARLMLATLEEGDEDPYPLFLLLGFDAATLEPLRRKLPALCKVMFEPFCAGTSYPIGSWKRGERIADVLGEDRWNFRASGPAELVFLMRAFHGLVFYLERLVEPVNWTWHIRPILERFSASAPELALPVEPDPRTSFSTIARYLRIQVLENEETKVKVTLPALAVDELETYLEGDVLTRIRTRGIDVAQLVREVRRGGYAPREIFVLDEPPRTFRVWLD